jgi:hypothetical protein
MRAAHVSLYLTVCAAQAPWQNTSLPVSERVANLLSLLTLEEKVANLYSNAAPGAPRLGLGSYRFDEECMRGAVSSGVSPRPLGTGFPTLLALAGTFNVPLLAAIGEVGAREVRAYYNIDRRTKGLVTTANCYAPVTNLVRDPRWGRSAEMAIGEDPTLGRVIARAWTAAMRGSAPGETAKLVSSVAKHLGTCVDHAQTKSPTPHATRTLTSNLPLPRNPNRSEQVRRPRGCRRLSLFIQCAFGREDVARIVSARVPGICGGRHRRFYVLVLECQFDRRARETVIHTRLRIVVHAEFSRSRRMELDRLHH